jgi:hypothetical protein
MDERFTFSLDLTPDEAVVLYALVAKTVGKEVGEKCGNLFSSPPTKARLSLDGWRSRVLARANVIARRAQREEGVWTLTTSPFDQLAQQMGILPSCFEDRRVGKKDRRKLQADKYSHYDRRSSIGRRGFGPHVRTS